MPNIAKININGTVADIKDTEARSDIATIQSALKKVSTSSDGFAPKVTSTSAYLRGDGTWSTPTDTTYAAATTKANGLMSSSDKSKLDGITSGAEVNQNAFANVVVGTTTVAADNTTDSLTLVGSNVTINPDATNDKVTIGITKDNVVSALGYTPPTTNTTYGTATTSADGLMSSSDKVKLNGIETGAQVNTITGVKGNAESSYRTGNVNITPANIGAVASSEKGAASGVVPLNASGTIDSTYLPSYVDDVLEYDSKDDFPKTGESGKIYVDISAEENNTYRWSGSKYILIAKNTNTTYTLTKSGSTITLNGSDGSTTNVSDSNTTYATATTSTDGLMSSSDKTKLNGIASGAQANQNAFSNIVVGTTTVAADNTTDSLTLVGSNVTINPDATNDKVTIGITKDNVVSALGYTPSASDTTYNVVSTGSNGLAPKVTNTSGFLRGDGTWATPTNTTYGTVSTSANGLAPKVTSTGAYLRGDGTWATPTNTTYAAATTAALGLVKTGSNITNSSGTISITKDNVTSALGYTPPTTNTTYGTGTTSVSGLTKLYTGTGSNTDGTMTQSAINSALSGKANSSHTHTKSQITDFPTIPTVNNPTITFTQNGSSKGTITLNQSGSSTIALSDTNTTYGTMGAATSSAAGSAGLVPAPASGKQSQFLRGDGTWATPTNTTYGTATTTANGLMSSSDKSKLDGVAANANNYSLPAATSSVLGGVKTGSNITNSSGTISITKDNVVSALGYTPPTTNTTYGTVSTSGNGLAPKVTSTSAYLRGDGTWATPTNTTYAAATSDALGLVQIGSNITNSDGTISITEDDVISALGYSPTTYGSATTAAEGLVKAAYVSDTTLVIF